MTKHLLLVALICSPVLGAPRNGDFDEDGTRDVSDVVGILHYLFSGGPRPVPGVVRRGLPTTGVLTCRGSAGPIVCPAPGGRFFGQDANFPALPHDFELVKPNPFAESTWYTIDHATG